MPSARISNRVQLYRLSDDLLISILEFASRTERYRMRLVCRRASRIVTTRFFESLLTSATVVFQPLKCPRLDSMPTALSANLMVLTLIFNQHSEKDKCCPYPNTLPRELVRVLGSLEKLKTLKVVGSKTTANGTVILSSIFEQLARTNPLPVDELALENGSTAVGFARRFSESLTHLSLRECQFSAAGARALYESWLFPNLKTLEFDSVVTFDGDPDEFEVNETPFMTRKFNKITTLRLRNTQSLCLVYPYRLVNALSLTRLDLTDTHRTIRDTNTWLDIGLDQMTNLSELDLGIVDGRIRDVGDRAVHVGQMWFNTFDWLNTFPAHLVRLDLQGQHLGDMGATQLVRSRYFDNLTWLNLANNHITHQSMAELATSVFFTNLTHLDLHGNPLTADGLFALAQGLQTPSLIVLNLSDTKFTFTDHHQDAVIYLETH